MITNVAPLRKSQYKGQNRKLLSFNRKVMQVTGIIPPERLSKNALKRMLFILYLIGWYCCCFLLNIAKILSVYHFWGNLEVTTFACVAVLGAAMTELEGIYGRLYSNSILKLLEFLEHDVNSKMEEMDLNENHIQILEKAKAKAKRFSVTLIVIIDVMVICWVILPFSRRYLREHNNEGLNVTTTQYDERWLDFCYIIWAPFDLTVSPYYEITYMLQVIDLIITTSYWKSVESTIMALIIYTSAHLKILETFLSEMKPSLLSDDVNGKSLIKSNNKHLANKSRPFTTPHQYNLVKQLGTAEHNQDCLSMDRLENNQFKNEKEKLKDFVMNFVNYHDVITEFVGKVNKTFGPVLFISFFVRQLMACLGLFQVALTEIDYASVINLATSIAIMTPHFIFCWYGNKLIENGQLMRQAAFENSMLHQSKEFKHFIIMLMSNTQKPLYFSALGFFKLSLPEFAKTMNGAYAYFNLLKNLHGDQ